MFQIPSSDDKEISGPDIVIGSSKNRGMTDKSQSPPYFQPIQPSILSSYGNRIQGSTLREPKDQLL